MKFYFLLLLTLLPGLASSHEVILSSRYLDIRKQNQIGWQHDVLGRATVNSEFDVGLQGTYLERFVFFEKRFGGFLTYRPKPGLSFELRYLRGDDTEILPENQTLLTTYAALGSGLTGFMTLNDARYSSTHLTSAQFGLEIEKVANMIFVPQVMIGKAIFRSPATTEGVYAYGLRAIYYREQSFNAFVYGFKGEEASQAIVGASSELISTTTGGFGGSYFLTEGVRGELAIDHTDYEDLHNQFLTTSFTLFVKF